MMKLLFVIPARGGSKGLPGKNIKPFLGKPLLHYSIQFARLFTKDENICLSTDSDAIIDCAKTIGLEALFIRPDYLSTDTAGSFEVLQHALKLYQCKNNIKYDIIILLQPTSPVRLKLQLVEALQLFNDGIDMVVSVTESKANPYFNLFEENKEGFLLVSNEKTQFLRRQDAPPVYCYNGSLYIINVRALNKYKSFAEFKRIRKYLMDEKYAIDLDTQVDWDYAEFIIKKEQDNQ